jgi:hypothetical protein
MSPQEMSAVALPPVPEEVDSYEELEQLAEMRDDDLVLGGTLLATTEPTALMEAANGVVQEYARLWAEHLARSPVGSLEAASEEDGGVGVNEVLYSFMGERDKLAEMSKLVARLRYAVEGRDEVTAKEAEDEMGVLNKYLPESYLVARLLVVARDPEASGAQLAQLYLERCYRLADGDAQGAHELEERIKAMESSE